MLDTKALSARLLAMSTAVILSAFSLGCGQCESDYDCDERRICHFETGACTDLECRVDRDCAPVQQCRTNRCVPADESTPPGDGDAVSLPMETGDGVSAEVRGGGVVDEN